MERLLNLPAVYSAHGAHMDHLMVLLHYLMGVLAVGWTLFFVYVLFRFRATRNQRADYKGVSKNTSTFLEFGVAGLEILLLVGFAIPLWGTVADNFPPESESTVVRVVAKQFAWTFIYPGPDGKFGRQDMTLVRSDNPFGFDATDEATKDNIIVLNQLHVPVGKPVILNMSSEDVIHSFKVVPLRITQDCIPGVNIPIHFVPTREGKYQVICAQLCGNGHASMVQGVVMVETAEDYQAWVASQSTGGGTATSFE